MALSNTAVPRYYGEFRDAVLAGEIPVNQEVSMQMELIDELIADPRYYYDDQAVEGWIRFCENELTLTDGSDLELLDTFKLWGEDLFGWYYFEEKEIYVPRNNGVPAHYIHKFIKRRLRHKQYLIVGRGAAKTLYDECVHAYGLIVDTDTTYQITTAPTIRQSEEVLLPFKTAIARARGPLFKFLTEGSLQNTTGSKKDRVKLASTKKGIENFITNSVLESRPMSIDKLQGARPKYSTIDEWLSGVTKEDVMGSLEQGASKIDDWIIVATSSEGTVRHGAGDSVKMELMKILKGEWVNPHISIWWYRLDDIKEVSDPSKWLKANPNLGKTVSYETYQQEVERAEHSPAARNDIIAKRFGIPMEGYTFFFAYEETLVHPRQNFYGMPCSLGCDLSQGDDFCAFTFMFPLSNGSFGIKARSYITAYTYDNLPKALKEFYSGLRREGTLIVMDDNVLDIPKVYDDLSKYIEDCDYEVRCMGYDPYNAKDFLELWAIDNGTYGIEKVIQGAKTETVPLGELKILAEQRMLIFDQDIMSWTMGNAITLQDTNGNRKLLKMRREKKIDNVSAMMDAYVAYKANKEQFD